MPNNGTKKAAGKKKGTAKQRQEKEDNLRDFLEKQVQAETFLSLITNLTQFREKLKADGNAFLKITEAETGPTAVQLLQEIFRRRQLIALDTLHSLALVGTNVKMLDTGVPGFQPSADLILRNYECGTQFIVEVKIHEKTEREAITELSAYTQGLNSRYWGLCPQDVVWMLISVDWKTMPHAALRYQSIFRGQLSIPLKAYVTWKGDVPVGVTLELQDLNLETSDYVAFRLVLAGVL